jgi:hypothetical protein
MAKSNNASATTRIWMVIPRPVFVRLANPFDIAANWAWHGVNAISDLLREVAF